MKKIVVFIIIALIIAGIASCGNSGSSSSYDDAMASYDWGDGYYYDRSSHKVEKTLW